MSEADNLEGGEKISPQSGRLLARVLAFKEKLRKGHTVIGAWLSLTDPVSAEVLGRTGFDFIIVDTEHGGAWDLKDVQAMLMALNGTSTVPIVRVPWNDHVRIKLMLDLGVEGILAPMVSTVAECRDLVAACKYPPAGRRGSGPRRASNYYRELRDYQAIANDAIFVMPQIENIATVDILDEYLAVPGIDAVAIGPNDMSGTAGVYPNRYHPTIIAAVDKICAAGKAHGVPVCLGVNTPPEEQRAWVEKGVRLLTVAGDLDLLVSGARNSLKATKDVLAD